MRRKLGRLESVPGRARAGREPVALQAQVSVSGTDGVPFHCRVHRLVSQTEIRASGPSLGLWGPSAASEAGPCRARPTLGARHGEYKS